MPSVSTRQRMQRRRSGRSTAHNFLVTLRVADHMDPLAIDLVRVHRGAIVEIASECICEAVSDAPPGPSLVHRSVIRLVKKKSKSALLSELKGVHAEEFAEKIEISTFDSIGAAVRRACIKSISDRDNTVWPGSGQGAHPFVSWKNSDYVLGRDARMARSDLESLALYPP